MEDDRSGKPDEISWNAMQQVRPHHEEPLLDGNAQSVRYGEMIHDGSGKPNKVMGQSTNVLSEIKTEVPLENDEPSISKSSIASI